MDIIDIKKLEQENKAYKIYINSVISAHDRLKARLEAITPAKKTYLVRSKEVGYIRNVICEVFDIDETAISSIRRNRYKNVYPRQMFVYLLCVLTNNTLEKVSKEVREGYDHASVIHCRESARNLLHPKFGDEFFIKKYQEVRDVLNKEHKFDLIRFEV